MPAGRQLPNLLISGTPPRNRRRNTMTYITVVDNSPARTVENLDKLMTDILPEPDGLAARYAGMADGKLCIVAIWDSREHAEAFMTERLGPGLRQLFGEAPTSPPRTLGLEVQHTHVR
jgi:hypothetical protein